MTLEIEDGHAIQALYVNELIDRWQYAVQSGCNVSINSGDLGQADTLQVASGEIFHDGNIVSVAQQNVELSTANNEDRKDIVYINGDGDAFAKTGTPEPPQPSSMNRFNAYRPAPKDGIEVDGTIVAVVHVSDNTSSVSSADIRDARLLSDIAARSLIGIDFVQEQSVRSNTPINPSLGDWYIDDGTNTSSGSIGFRVYNGSSWIDAGDGGGSGDLTVQNDGSSVDTAVETVDFAGSDFSVANPSSGIVDVTLNTDSVSTSEIDTTIAPTWTGLHTFEQGTSSNLLSLSNSSTSDEFRFSISGSDNFTFNVLDSSTSTEQPLLVFSPDSQEISVPGDLNFSGLTDSPTFSGHDHSEGGLSAISNAGLLNSSITVSTGTGIGGGASVSLGGTVTLDVHEKIAYEPGHTEWSTGLSNEEIKRIEPPSGTAVTIEAISFQQKGGGSGTSASIDIYDVDAGSELSSVVLSNKDRTGYTAGDGNTVIVRLSNSSGSPINAEPIVRGYIS